MSTVKELVETFAIAIANGWQFVGVYPQADQPWGLHNGFISRGHEVADTGFDGAGNPVTEGYALWVRMTDDSELADCGCVHHAEERILCEHDIALALGP